MAEQPGKDGKGPPGGGNGTDEGTSGQHHEGNSAGIRGRAWSGGGGVLCRHRASGTAGPEGQVHTRQPRSNQIGPAGASGSAPQARILAQAHVDQDVRRKRGSGPKCLLAAILQGHHRPTGAQRPPGRAAESSTASRETGGSVTIRSSSRRRTPLKLPATSRCACEAFGEAARARPGKDRASPTGPMTLMLGCPGRRSHSSAR